MKKITAFALLSLLIISACKKYPEGPALSLRSKKARMANTWIISKAYENGTDKTADYLAALKDFTLVIDKSGSYSSTYSAYGLIVVSETGNWEFSGNKDYVIFDPISNNNGNTSYKILKLKEDELWVFNDNANNNGTDQELHLISK